MKVEYEISWYDPNSESISQRRHRWGLCAIRHARRLVRAGKTRVLVQVVRREGAAA